MRRFLILGTARIAGAGGRRLLLFLREEQRHPAARAKVFVTWDPQEKVETFTVQPKFEGNALDFGMVIPTPSQPKLHEMPRKFLQASCLLLDPEA